jgi:polyferredoxin
MTARYVQPLRILVQMIFLGLTLWLGLRFYHFVSNIIAGDAVLIADRPAGIEAFLPISGLLGLTAWIKGAGLNSIHPAAAVMLLAAISVALLLRRSFCSWICPLATISECVWKTGFNLFRCSRSLPKALDVLFRCIKYLLLAFFLHSIIITMSAESLQLFIHSDYHKIADVRMLDYFWHISPMALSIILFLLAISLLLRNPFCRFLCPYGALLGLAALLSPTRVSRDEECCIACGVCSQVCPSHIDVMRKKSVVSVECIGCWRCISHCRVNEALSMRFAGRYAIPGILFAMLVVFLFWGGSLIAKATGNWQTSIGGDEYRLLLKR